MGENKGSNYANNLRLVYAGLRPLLTRPGPFFHKHSRTHLSNFYGNVEARVLGAHTLILLRVCVQMRGLCELMKLTHLLTHLHTGLQIFVQILGCV